MILPQFLISVYLIQQLLQVCEREAPFASLVARQSKHLLVRLNEVLDFGPIEEACAEYHHKTGPGRKAEHVVSRLVRALLVGYLYGLSLRKLEERLDTDMLVRWFVGYGLEDRVPDHSTLERFELWLIAHHPDLYFSTVLKQVDGYFPAEKQKVQIGDSYAMLANAAEEGLVGRIRHVCRRFMMELVDDAPANFETYWQGFEWEALFGPKPENASDLMDKEARARRLQTTAMGALDFQRRAEELLNAHSRNEYRFLRQWLGYLGKVLNDELKIERDEQGQVVKITELPTKEKGDFRLISATDPEATYRMHGDEREDINLGYNVQVAATVSAFIRETKAYTGADPDQSGVAALIAEQILRTGDCPPKFIYDMAAGSGKTRAEVARVSGGLTLLVAKSMPYASRSARFGPYNFVLSEDGQSLTCPQGKTSTISYPSKDGEGQTFRFYALQCWTGDPPTRMKKADPEKRCPLWEQCRDSRHGPGAMRQVFISNFRHYVLEAEAYNQTEAFQKEMKQRPLIERIIFELTNYCGARNCRRRGLAAADFQAKMAAAVYNLKLLVRRLARRSAQGAAMQNEVALAA